MTLTTIALLSSVALFCAILSMIELGFVVDLEHPRLGLIRMSDSEGVLVSLRESMN